MAQHDYVIANANGATVRADINNALLAISSTNSGSSEPSTPYAYEMWVDTSNNLLKLRNAANDGWITLGVSITASNTVDINGGAIDGTPIGASSASTGAFSTLSTTDNLSIGGSNKELRFYEGSNYVGFEAPALTGDQIWVLPSADGSADQVLTTDGSGALSFSTVSGTTINSNADNRVITGSDSANTLNGETGLTWDGSTFTADGGAVFNDSSADVDFRVESNGNANMLFVDGGNDRVGIGTASPDALIEIVSSDPRIRLRDDTAGGAADGGGILEFVGYHAGSGDGKREWARISGLKENSTGGSVNGYLKFYTNGGSLTEKMRIDSNGVLQFTESTANSFINASSTPQLELDVNRNPETGSFGSSSRSHARILISGADGGSHVQFNTASANNTVASERMRVTSDGDLLIGATSDPSGSTGGAGFLNESNSRRTFICASTTTSSIALVAFRNTNGDVGTIQTSGSSTSYNTSSDYRLKENVVTDWNATTRLKQLKPSLFNFIADSDTTLEGFLAHEVADIVPQAITGEKDAVNADGSIKAQQIDKSKLVPLLVKTIQELEERITALESA